MRDENTSFSQIGDLDVFSILFIIYGTVQSIGCEILRLWESIPHVLTPHSDSAIIFDLADQCYHKNLCKHNHIFPCIVA